jgi:hypothetical protein
VPRPILEQRGELLRGSGLSLEGDLLLHGDAQIDGLLVSGPA